MKKGDVRKLVEGFDYIRLGPRADGMKYMLLRPIHYWSRYEKQITAKTGMMSDGATGATDIEGSMSWWIHDVITDNPFFDDGTPVTNWAASMIIKDILQSEGRFLRMIPWKYATFIFGGWKNKKRVGWFIPWKANY